ncbi:DUF7168 domain-containing protein [Haloferula sargassicola]|uniref:DUF2786 domain-containing protein n=1 Tax=Haloferula sargassicola TaxID=490096 RepID=A0ABP9ULH8_9BACT
MSSPIIDRIKKLLRLGRCHAATPAEAANALAKALKLAAEHGIDLSQLPTDDPERGGVTHVTEPSQAGLPHRLASRLVKRHFGVSTVFEKGGPKPVIHFVGVESQCQLAVYCYVFLVRTMRAAWRHRTNRRLRDRESFLHGFATAIDRAMPPVFHQPGLTISHDAYIVDVIVGKGGSLKEIGRKTPRKLSEAATREGYRAGRKTSIHNALRGTDKPLLS